MGESAMPRSILGSLLIVLLSGAYAEAQIITAGSTPAGDYLRGVGIAGWGMGLYNLNTAQADQINAQTFIMLNEYMWNVVKNENRENAEYRRQMRARVAEAYKKLQERLRNQPERTDVNSAAALNAKLKDVLDPRISDSVARYARVPLDADTIRHIPFQLGEKGEKFSMSRLMLNGRSHNWVVAFQNPAFQPFCRAYEKAVQEALVLAMDRKMTPEAIRAVRKAVDDLQDKVNHTSALLDPRNQRQYSEAKEQLDAMQLSARLFETAKMQVIFAAIDTYLGSTVDDLRIFMRDHGLTFAAAKTPDEVALYSKLYEALALQLEKSTAPGQQAGN
jgi:hypothetical protein